MVLPIMLTSEERAQIPFSAWPTRDTRHRPEKPYMIEVKPHRWSQFPGSKDQRDTERHADKIEDELQEFLPQHGIVEAVQFPDGSLRKSNGHTRDLLWSQKRAPVPESVFVVITQTDSEKNATAQFFSYDNPLTSKQLADRVQGALRRNGIVAKSSIVKRGTIGSALWIAEWVRLGRAPAKNRKLFDVTAATKEWRLEILAMDEIILGRDTAKVHNGMLAAMMLSIRKYGLGLVSQFWAHVMNPAVFGDMREPFNALKRHMDIRRGGKRTSGYDNSLDITSKSLSACKNDLEGIMVTGLKGIKLPGYLERNVPSPSKDQEDISFPLRMDV